MSKITILIVEDDAVIARSLQAQLEGLGYVVPFISATGRDALGKVKENSVDLVLMDIRLGGEMDGIETAEQMRIKFNVPVIYLTAYTDEEILKRARMTGPYGYLVKPVSGTEMVCAIEMAIHKCQMERELIESEKKYSVLVETAKDGVVIIKDGVYKFANRAMESIIGYTTGELVSIKVMDTVAPEYRPMVAERYESLIAGKQVPSNYEFTVRCKGGETKDVELSASLIQYKREPAIMGFVRDITDRKKTENEIKKHRAQLAELVEERTSELTAANKLLQQEVNERKVLEKALLETQERELQRIGYELHDGLGQILTGLSLKSQSLEDRLKEKLMPEAEVAARITSLIEKSKEHLKFLMKGTFPMNMDRHSITLSLDELASRVTRDFNLPCHFRCNTPIEFKCKEAVIHFYRIAQEAVTNSVRHGKPEKIDISLSKVDNRIKLSIMDDGTGIPDVHSNKDGMGLKIMNYRANIIGALLDIESETNKGTRITCTFKDGTSDKY
jgi:PAS domain S-box-containing protein